MNEVQIFNNQEFGEIRTIEIDGKPYFVGADIARALGYKNTSKAISDHCKGVTKRYIPTNGGNQEMNVIPKGDIYRLAANSELPGADKFERWIFDEVLVSIDEHGGYLTSKKIEEVLNDPDTIIQLATTLKQEREQCKALQAQLDYSKEWYSIKRVAQINQRDWKLFSWKKLKEVSLRLGKPPKKIFDANYGEVNIYHQSAWEKVYPYCEL